jgi:hypothetical protein
MGDNPAIIVSPAGAVRALDRPLAPAAWFQCPLDPRTVLVAAPGATDGQIHSIDRRNYEWREAVAVAAPEVEDWMLADPGLKYSWIGWMTANRYVYGKTRGDLDVMFGRFDSAGRRESGRGELVFTQGDVAQ